MGAPVPNGTTNVPASARRRRTEREQDEGEHGSGAHRALRSVSSRRWTGRRCTAPAKQEQPRPRRPGRRRAGRGGRAGRRRGRGRPLRQRARRGRGRRRGTATGATRPPEADGGEARKAVGALVVARSSTTAAVTATAAVAAAAARVRGLDVREAPRASSALHDAAECPEPGQATAQVAAQPRLGMRERAVVGRAREPGGARSAALGVRARWRPLRRVEAFEGEHEIGADAPPVRRAATSSRPSASDPGSRARLVALGQLVAERERCSRAPAAAVVDGLVARDHRGAGADQLERQRELGRGRAEQREHDLGAHVAGVLRLDAGAAQLRVHGAAHALARDRVAHVSRQHACGGAQADAARGVLQLLHRARLHLLLARWKPLQVQDGPRPLPYPPGDAPALRHRDATPVREGRAAARRARASTSSSSSPTPASTTTTSSRGSSTRSSGSGEPDVRLEVGSGSHAEQTAAHARRDRARGAGAPARRDARLRRHQLDARGRARRRQARRCRWRTSRPACARSTCACRRRSTASSPTGSRGCCSARRETAVAEPRGRGHRAAASSSSAT